MSKECPKLAAVYNMSIVKKVIKPPTKIKQNTQTNNKVVQAETSTLDSESASKPQQNQSK